MIHAPNRLQICALLETTKELEFQVIKEQLDVSDSVLSKHLKVLEDADYIRKDARGPPQLETIPRRGHKLFG